MKTFFKLALLTVASAKECDLLYIDIGSNDGETIENFIKNNTEAALKSTLLQSFKFDMKRACVIGFEPNPRWNARLTKLKNEYERNVSSLDIHANTAAIASDDVDIDISLDSTKNNVGTSIYSRKSSRKARTKAIRLSAYLKKYLAQTSRRPVILIRMDIEGYEYELIPELVTSGVLQKYETYFVVEWHRYLKKKPFEKLDLSMQHFNRARQCSVDCSSIYHNLEKILTYMIRISGAVIHS